MLGIEACVAGRNVLGPVTSCSGFVEGGSSRARTVSSVSLAITISVSSVAGDEVHANRLSNTGEGILGSHNGRVLHGVGFADSNLGWGIASILFGIKDHIAMALLGVGDSIGTLVESGGAAEDVVTVSKTRTINPWTELLLG